MSNNIPVNGWPQLKDLEAVQPTLDRLDKIEAWKRTVKEETFTGSDLTIENALALPARSLITSINAIQDLHGLPFPYVGGAYKNKLPMTVESIKAANTTGTWSGNIYTINSGTITILTDNADNVTGFKVNGTFSDGTSFNIISSLTLPQVDYILSGSANFNNNFFIAVQTSGGNVIATTTDVTITGTITNALCWIRIGANETVSNKTIQPMIRLATVTDASFAPYSNVCPISGRSEARVDTENEDSTESAYAVIQLGTTVYGAKINWDMGVMTVTDGMVDLGDLTWTAVNGSRFLSVNEMPNVKIDTSVSTPRNAICSQYVWKKGGDLFNLDDAGFSYYIEGGENRLFVKDLRYSDAATFKAAMDGVTLVYKLATPTTIQLTPTQLEMLKGYNRVTLSDGYGTIELKALTGANWS